jgi:cyclohexa-1,5-dienecarbonyl-CoA hydratase
VNVVLPAENFRKRWRNIASYLDKSRTILVWTKRAIRTYGPPFAEGLRAAEIAYLDGCMNTEDAKEGIAAFMEKRKPVWKDK